MKGNTVATLPFKLEDLEPGKRKIKVKKKNYEVFKKITILQNLNSNGFKENQKKEPCNMVNESNSSQSADLYLITENENAYLKGLEEGEEKALRKLKEFFDSLGLLSHEMKKKIEELDGENMSFSIQMSLKIAEKIVGSELSVNEEAVGNVLRRVLKKVPKSGEIKILMNMSDLERFKSLHPKIDEFLGGISETVVFEGSEKVKSGGCYVHTEMFCMDSSIEKQLENIGSKLLETVSKKEK